MGDNYSRFYGLKPRRFFELYTANSTMFLAFPPHQAPYSPPLK